MRSINIRNCNGTVLLYDQACLEVLSRENVTFWSQYEICEACALFQTAYFHGAGSLVIATVSPLHYAVRNGSEQICNGTYQFGEFGHYQLNVSGVTTQECLPRITVKPQVASLPILKGVVVLIAMAILWYGVKRIAAGRYFANCYKKKDIELAADTAEVDTRPLRSRVRSLDILRGFCVSFMVFVSMGSGGHQVFMHSVWDGCTLADLVAPWFEFSMGEALVLSLRARLRTGMPRTTAFYQVARRSLVMALLGVWLNWHHVIWQNLRLSGEMQRLGALYLLMGGVECATHVTTTTTAGHSLFRDIAAGWKQWLFTLSFVAVHTCMWLLVAAPGCPRRYAGPGGLHRSALGYNLTNCTGGISGYIDRIVIGEKHLPVLTFIYKTYNVTIPFDDNGLMGVLSGTLVVQAGAHASRIMLAYNLARARMLRWTLWALWLGVAGAALSYAVPLNRNLWSLSLCLVGAGSAMLIKAVLYFIVDVKHKWGGQPLYYAGQNALLVYFGHLLLISRFPMYCPISEPTHAQLLAHSTAVVLLWLAVSAALYKRRVFISL